MKILDEEILRKKQASFDNEIGIIELLFNAAVTIEKKKFELTNYLADGYVATESRNYLIPLSPRERFFSDEKGVYSTLSYFYDRKGNVESIYLKSNAAMNELIGCRYYDEIVLDYSLMKDNSFNARFNINKQPVCRLDIKKSDSGYFLENYSIRKDFIELMKS